VSKEQALLPTKRILCN